jgi:hypothetical protein
LRAALEQPFPASAPIWINFLLSGSGPYKLQPAQALPTLANPVFIDGLSQTGASCATPLIELDGTLLPGTPAIAGLVLGPYSANSTIRGLAINRFSGPALVVTTSNNILSCSWLGVRLNGDDPPPANGQGAIDITGGGQLALDSTDKIGGTVKVEGGQLKITNPVVIKVNNN